jgi:Cof subfamily protein (haloacid dehalogenase superfamily)
MDLIVFDLDGTLLNASSEISSYTRDTLLRLSEKGIAYTVATGRALHGSRKVLEGHNFRLPQAFKNGVLIWNPTEEDYSHHNFLTLAEIQHIVEAMIRQDLTPFMFTLEPGGVHRVYHPPLKSEIEIQLAEDFANRDELGVFPAAQLPANAEITNISALGLPERVDAVDLMISNEPMLVAYAGTALEGADLKWIDIHHVEATKGNAAEVFRRELGASRVICFGDSDNDLSMFATADEAYAPSNAKPEVLRAATAVIGHHDEDGVARFLRERFSLD